MRGPLRWNHRVSCDIVRAPNGFSSRTETLVACRSERIVVVVGWITCRYSCRATAGGTLSAQDPTMARPRMLDSMTIAQLEGLLSSRRTRLNQLARDRKKAQSKLDAID